MKVAVWQGDDVTILGRRHDERIAAAARSWGHDATVIERKSTIWPTDADVIVVMGSSSALSDIREVVDAAGTGRVRLVGIGSGASMIARALGAKVVDRDEPHIECAMTSSGRYRMMIDNHHIDPDSLDAEILESTSTASVVRFRHGQHIEAVQYHLELKQDDATRLVIEHCGGSCETALRGVVAYRYDDAELRHLIQG